MFCPNCRAEYREGIAVCPECGINLIEELKDDINHNETPCLVYVAANEFEADVIIAKLKAEGIFAFKRFKGSDSYNRIVLGRTILGVDIIVAESDFENAKEIVRNR